MAEQPREPQLAIPPPRRTFKEKFIDFLKPEAAPPPGVEAPREAWSNRFTFFISTLGMSVGLGHIWRFPTLTYEKGGGAFVILYIVMILTLGNALYFFEMVNGQYSSQNCLNVYKKCPVIEGVGWSMITYSFLFCIYYNNMVAFSFYYFFASFMPTLPWSYCPNEQDSFFDSVKCREFVSGLKPNEIQIKCGNASMVLDLLQACDAAYPNNTEPYNQEMTIKCNESGGIFNISDNCRSFNYPSDYYWSHFVTHSYRNTDENFGYIGPPHWGMIGCLFLAWFLNYLSLYKGLKSMGMIMYIMVPLPYIVLFILLFAAVGQPGAMSGWAKFFVPDMSSFLKPDIWRSAIEQACYSIGVAMGPLITFGSYNAFNSPIHIDSIIISCCIVLTSILCASVVFNVLGFLSYKTKIPFNEVAQKGPGLVFTVYPQALELLPWPNFFSVLFYFMLINIGSSTVSSIIETTSSAFYDFYPESRKRKWLVNLFVCFIAFFLGIPICCRGGLVYYDMFDFYAAGLTLMPICAIELAGIVYIYGIGRFCEDIAFMLGWYPNRWMRYLFLSGPVILVVIVTVGMASMEIPKDWKWWPVIVGWILFMLVMIWVPFKLIFNTYIAYKHDDYKELITPKEGSEPKGKNNEYFRSLFVTNRQIW